MKPEEYSAEEERQALKEDRRRKRPGDKRKRYRTLTPSNKVTERHNIDVDVLESEKDFSDGAISHGPKDRDMSLDNRYASYDDLLDHIDSALYGPGSFSSIYMSLRTAADEQDDEEELKGDIDGLNIDGDISSLSDILHKIEKTRKLLREKPGKKEKKKLRKELKEYKEDYKSEYAKISGRIFNTSSVKRIETKLNKVKNIALGGDIGYPINGEVRKKIDKMRNNLFNSIFYEFRNQMDMKPSDYVILKLRELDNKIDDVYVSRDIRNESIQKSYSSIIDEINKQSTSSTKYIDEFFHLVKLVTIIKDSVRRHGVQGIFRNIMKVWRDGDSIEKFKAKLSDDDETNLYSIALSAMANDLLIDGDILGVIETPSLIGEKSNEYMDQARSEYEVIKRIHDESNVKETKSKCGKIKNARSFDKLIRRSKLIDDNNIIENYIYGLVRYASSVCEENYELAESIVEKSEEIRSNANTQYSAIMNGDGLSGFSSLDFDVSTVSGAITLNNTLAKVIDHTSSTIRNKASGKLIDMIMNDYLDRRSEESIRQLMGNKKDLNEVMNSMLKLMTAKEIHSEVFGVSGILSGTDPKDVTLNGERIRDKVLSKVMDSMNKAKKWFSSVGGKIKSNFEDAYNTKVIMRNLRDSDKNKKIGDRLKEMKKFSETRFESVDDMMRRNDEKSFKKQLGKNLDFKLDKSVLGINDWSV